MSTGHNIIYFNWQVGEPNNLNSTENCIEIRNWGKSGYTWNDLNCDTELYFICESLNGCNK